jgi:hypothetical protein
MFLKKNMKNVPDGELYITKVVIGLHKKKPYYLNFVDFILSCSFQLFCNTMYLFECPWVTFISSILKDYSDLFTLICCM